MVRFASSALAAFVLAFGAASARPIAISDMRAIAVLEQPAIAPDGSRVAVVVTRDAKSSLVLVDAKTGGQTTIASGGNVADPRWSPDGSALGYLQQENGGGKLQLFTVTNANGPRQITHSATDLTDFAWSPDGRTIAYDAPDVLSSSGFFYAGDNDYTLTAPIAPLHLWLVAAAGGPARRLTSGPWTIAPTDLSGIFSPQFAWTHDGKHVVFTHIESTFTGEDEYSTLWEADVSTLAMHPLTRRTMLELSPSFSPDGSHLVYWYPLRGDYLSENTLRMIDGTRDVSLTARIDRNVIGTAWMPDGRSFLACGDDGTRVAAWQIRLDGSYKELDLGGRNIVCDSYSSSTFDAGIDAVVARTGAVAYLADDATHARELYYLPSLRARPLQLTHFNDAIARLDLAPMRQITWRSPDGFTDYGVVTYPPHAVPGRKYPILVQIHGGPGLASVQSFAYETWPRTQLFAADGYIVFEPNYRGSDNAGNAFMRAIYRDTVSGPSADILSGLDAVKKLPGADPSRIAVCGWSYGGLLTSWLITQHHFWRAAVTGAAVNDEIEEYNLSYTNVQNRYYLGASPYTRAGHRIYTEQSPITFASQVTTPTLIWGTTLDSTVPVPQSYSFFHALKEHHVPVQFAVFPASTHGPADQAQTATLTKLWLDWLDLYVKH